MKKILILILVILTSCAVPKTCCGQFTYKGYEYDIKKILSNQLKFSTVYAAVNGGTSVSDVKTFSVQ